MNVLDAKLPTPGSEESATEFVDQVLRAFFRAEIPMSWPSLTVSPAQPRRFGGTRRWGRGRMVLAASLLLLMAGQGFLFQLASSSPVNREALTSEPTEAMNRGRQWILPRPAHVNKQPISESSTRQDSFKGLKLKEK